MSPTPTDVGSYQGNGQATVAGHGTTIPIPVKVGPQHEREDSASSNGAPVAPDSRGAPPPRPNSAAGSVTSSQQSASCQAANGGGPGHMPSGISVQELKQMTALRMAHEQGHLRVVSPFHYSESVCACSAVVLAVIFFFSGVFLRNSVGVSLRFSFSYTAKKPCPAGMSKKSRPS